MKHVHELIPGALYSYNKPTFANRPVTIHVVEQHNATWVISHARMILQNEKLHMYMTYVCTEDVVGYHGFFIFLYGEKFVVFSSVSDIERIF